MTIHPKALYEFIETISSIQRPPDGSLMIIKYTDDVDGEILAEMADEISKLEQFKGVPFLFIPSGVTIDTMTREEVDRFLEAQQSKPKDPQS